MKFTKVIYECTNAIKLYTNTYIIYFHFTYIIILEKKRMILGTKRSQRRLQTIRIINMLIIVILLVMLIIVIIVIIMFIQSL